ncbi:hypothetical protein [Nocardioides sp. AE5]|uniref:hypothetical protein n=1 Tax=Nocardioides sp. AE5 TaxID=2962573 RepID=UPI002882699E|nr:hypothetical protein [Nocardioides sp. AE5]MDT0201090.1 hypothetical protein [Nocardioides sp. AE5]
MEWEHCFQFFEQVGNADRRTVTNRCAEMVEGGVDTATLVRQAFEDVVIPASAVVVQPPGGVTLVNLETLFRTEAAPFEESVSLLGRQVVLRIRPVEFVWHPGDGSSFSTTSPGRVFEKGRPMSDYVSHTYPDVHEQVMVSVDVVWAAEYSVDGGPFLPVAGTVTTSGPGVGLQVKEAVPVLVSGG